MSFCPWSAQCEKTAINAPIRSVELDMVTQCNNIVIMKAAIVRIGNSRGIRIPKPLIEQCELENEVELVVRGRDLVIHSLRAARAGWDEAFRRMAACGDDILIDKVAEPSTEWDEREW